MNLCRNAPAEEKQLSVILAKHAGFCFGVKRATEQAEKLASGGGRIYTLGHLIHNGKYTKKLESMGVYAIAGSALEALMSKAPANATVIIRAHGITKQLAQSLKKAEENDPTFHTCDCTCPFVSKIHRIMDENTSEETFTVIFGDEMHPEVKGIVSYIHGEYAVIASSDKLSELLCGELRAKLSEKSIIVACQTTLNHFDYEKSKKILQKLYTNALFFDTICCVTEERQLETEKLACDCDVMLVVGDVESANSRKLYEIAKAHCENTFFIESAADIPDNIKKMHCKAGIAAGASTPGYIIEEVQTTMSEHENFAELLDESFKNISTGDTVVGYVMSVSGTEVRVDIGSKCTGILTLDNVTDDPQAKLENLFKVGDQIEAVAYRVSDVDGIAFLSTKKITAANDWKLVQEAFENGTVLEGRVTEAVKGGVVIRALSQRIFVPASQTMVPRDGDLSTLVGTTQKFKIIDLDASRRRVLGSIRVVAREERKAREEAFWNEIEVGKHYTGTVKSMTSYGVFVDLGGVDGMVHSSELTWLHISNPKDIVSIGDKLDVFVKSFDREKGRISLGHKTEETNPWTLFRAAHNVGDVVSVTIASMMPFGAFAQIIPGVDGLIHISQIADKKLAHPSDVLEKGQVVDAKITDIDDEKHKVSLSIRALLAKEEPAEEETPAQDAE